MKHFQDLYDHKSGLVDTYMRVCRSQEAMEIGDIEYGDSNMASAVFRVKCYPIDSRHIYITYRNITVLASAKEHIAELKQENMQLKAG